MKSKLPRPLVEAAKKVVIPVLRNKWKKHPIVSEWVSQGYIDDEEIDGIVLNWYIHKKPVPGPHKIKQLTIKELGDEYGCSYLVETGTYRGDMLNAQKDNFEKLFSIELSEDFWNKAKERFKGVDKINLLQGDSGKVLPQLAPTLDKPTLFWLDGHYCGGVTALSDIECPIYAELDAVFDNNKNHVVLIDDARDFVGERDYPTIAELTSYIKNKDSNYDLSVKDDMIRVVYKK